MICKSVGNILAGRHVLMGPDVSGLAAPSATGSSSNKDP